MSNPAAEIKGNIEVCDGNKAVAHGVLLSRPDVIAVYPITPQSAVGEWLSRWNDEGKLDETEKLILRVARIFGECELTIPKDFIGEVKNYINKWLRDNGFLKSKKLVC